MTLAQTATNLSRNWRKRLIAARKRSVDHHVNISFGPCCSHIGLDVCYFAGGIQRGFQPNQITCLEESPNPQRYSAGALAPQVSTTVVVEFYNWHVYVCILMCTYLIYVYVRAMHAVIVIYVQFSCTL